MNFNKDIIHSFESQNIIKTASDLKSTAKKVADDLAPGTSKDLSSGMRAEDAMGRASFSILNGASQTKLSQNVDMLLDKLKFDKNSLDGKSFLKVCKDSDDKFDEASINLANKYLSLADKKPDELKYAWKTYFPDLIKLSKKSDGTVNNEIQGAIEDLLRHDKISVRGIPDIISGCKEYRFDKDGKCYEYFDKNFFNKYKEFMDINSKSMFEQDDIFTLYLGNALKGSKLSNHFRDGQEDFIDNVAFNYAKILYEHGAGIVDMQMFLQSCAKKGKGGEKLLPTGFDFTPKDGWDMYGKIITDLKSVLGDDVAKACQVDGKDSLHNLLVADTLAKDAKIGGLERSYSDGSMRLKSPDKLVSAINKMKDENGLARTDIASYLCKKDHAFVDDIDEIKQCLNKNGTINGNILRKVFSGEINPKIIELVRVDGEINPENVNVLEYLVQQGHSSANDPIGVFMYLKNKDGIVPMKLMQPLTELSKYTSYECVKSLTDCMTAKGDVDRTLLELKKKLLGRNSYERIINDICKNSDGTANLAGVEATEAMLKSGLGNKQYVVNAFKHENGYDYQALKDFSKEFEETDKSYRDRILDMSVVGERGYKNDTSKLDVERFRALKKTFSNPELKPVLDDYANTEVIESSLGGYRLKETPNGEDLGRLYRFSHLKPKDIETLEKHGYSAKFYHELGKEQKYFVETSKDAAKAFDKDFVSGSTLENLIKEVNISDISLDYGRAQLTDDITRVIEKLPKDDKATLERVFRLEFGKDGIEGFPQRFDKDINPPKGLEKEFKTINDAINKFYSGEIHSDDAKTTAMLNAVTTGFPEFKMLIGKTNEHGERVDIKTLKDLKTLVSSPEYDALPQEDKTVSKMTVLLHGLEDINSKPKTVKQHFMSENDGMSINISSDWKKSAEYANSILDRYGMSEAEKYRTVQLLNDVGWAEKLNKGELTPKDIAINQRYKGDEKVSPLVEKVIAGDCKYDKAAVEKEAHNIHKNQQVLMTSTLKEFEPYIQTKIINGRELKYIDLDRPELKDKPILAHFLGYDGRDHTLNMLKNKAYRSSISASLVKGDGQSSCFAGRNTGIVLEHDNVNVANVYDMNIDSGFGKQYGHLKTALSTGSYKDIKYAVQNKFNLTDEEYGELMEKIVHSKPDEIKDCIINGKKISKDDLIATLKGEVSKITDNKMQNETVVLNPRPVGFIGIGESLDSYDLQTAVFNAQENGMPLFFKRKLS